MDAVESGLRQTLKRELYEVVVACDFHDFDEALTEKGCSLVHVGRPSPVGNTLASAVEHSSGEVLAFLEDDDLCTPGRLERIFHVFRTTPDLSFYRNQPRHVYSAGAWKLKGERTLTAPASVSLNASTSGVLYTLLKWGAASSTSTMAVRRNVVDGVLEELRSIRVSPDSFLFYAAAVKGGVFLLDSLATTVQRHHGVTLSGYTGGYPGYLRQRSRFHEMSAADYEVMASLCRGKPCYQVIRDRLSVARAQREVFLGDARARAASLPGAAAAALRARDRYYSLSTALLLISLISGETARRLNFMYESGLGAGGGSGDSHPKVS